MKENQQNQPKQLVNKPQNADELANQLLHDNKDGGAILLDEFCGKLPNVPRMECVRILKNHPHGVFIVGRKGHKSRWVYGKMAQDIKNSSSSFPNPGRQNRSNKPTKAQEIQESAGEMSAESFKLHVVAENGQEFFLPLRSIELVAV